MEDKTLTCKDCGKEFVFTVAEQEFYAEKGFQNEPRRCPECRRLKKQKDAENNQTRQFYTVTCSACGKETQVPFKPTGVRPVYCRECFDQMKNGEL